MILAIDVDYRDDIAFIAGVTFKSWKSEAPLNIYESKLNNILPYRAGEFYQRELPCIMHLLNEHNLTPDMIIVDSFVWLDGVKKPGLGAYLFEALDEKIPVIGVAKRSFSNISDEYKLYRGKSNKPLFITSVGIDVNNALEFIKNMSGDFRIPDLLKKVDSLCRESNL